MRAAFWGLTLLLQISYCQGDVDESNGTLVKLFDDLNISDIGTQAALREVVQATWGDDPGSKARYACAVSQVVFSTDNNGSDEVPAYLDTISDASLYLSRTEVHWSDNCWQNASCILSPAEAKDVAKIMTIITTTQAKFSVRSGGHDFNVNHSSVGFAGVLIDLTSLNGVEISTDRTQVTVGAGARWGAVYRALNGTGVSVNGGKNPSPAVAGQTLGGGHGWLTNSAGVTAASLVAAEVVLANGTVVQATEDSAPELLWALRGGGPNFGVVTRLTYRTIPVDRVWFARWNFKPDKNRQLLEALVEYHELAANDTKASVVFQLSVDNSSASSFVGFYYEDLIEYPPVFAPFYKIEPAARTLNSTFGTIADLAFNYDGPQYPDPGVSPSRDYVVSTAHLIDKSTYDESYAEFEPLAEQALQSGWIMNYGSQSISRAGSIASSNTPLGLEPVGQDWVHVTINWSSSENDEAAQGLIRTIGERIDEISSRRGSKVAYRFMNDAYDGQPVFASYGKDNFRRLSDIRRQYDRDEVFQRLQNGGWLISREEGDEPAAA